MIGCDQKLINNFLSLKLLLNIKFHIKEDLHYYTFIKQKYLKKK
jgi:hypothetical protein